jgi:hypothetical protein
MAKKLNGKTHCLNCGNEYIEECEFQFNMCTDCISDATTQLMRQSENYVSWREIEE